MPTQDVLSALPMYIHHDNAMGVKWLGVRYTLASLAFLNAVGAIADANRITLTLQTLDGRDHRVTVEGGSHALRFPSNLQTPPSATTVPRVLGSISTMYWQDSDPGDARRFIALDVPVSLTSIDYFAERDPALEAIFRLIDRGS